MREINPVDYSLQECEFLYKHLGEPWVVAGQDIKSVRVPNPRKGGADSLMYPDGVIPASVKPVIDRVYELIELEKHSGQPWIGVEKVKEALKTYLDQAAKWEASKGRRGAPRFPSMASFDGKNRPHLQAPGSDSGKVTTYFDTDGQRKSLIIQLMDVDLTEWVPEWASPEPPAAPKVDPAAAVITNDQANRVECLVCGHTESFKPESRASFNAARARMSRHLRSSKVQVELHREAHSNEFGG